jgi:NADPH2:quinone reductase
VITTVSSDERAKLGHAARANDVVNYRSSDAADQIRGLAPDGVDILVELAPSANAALDGAVLAANGTVAVYATDGGNEVGLAVRDLMSRNIRYQFVLVYTVPPAAKDHSVADVAAAVADGALPVGADAGLPLHRFALEQTAEAHAAFEGGAVGKVIIDVG